MDVVRPPRAARRDADEPQLRVDVLEVRARAARIEQLQRREARRKVLAVPSRTTFFDMAHTRSTGVLHEGGEYPRVVTWPVYLEHKLRQLLKLKKTYRFR